MQRTKPHIKIMSVYGGQRVWRCCDPENPRDVHAGLSPEEAYIEWQHRDWNAINPTYHWKN
jgi:hypothetical protein